MRKRFADWLFHNPPPWWLPLVLAVLSILVSLASILINLSK